MRLLSIPSAYRRHFETVISKAMTEIARDMAYRSDEDPRVRVFAGLSIDETKTGTTTIVVAIEDSRAITDVPVADGVAVEPIPIERRQARPLVRAS